MASGTALTATCRALDHVARACLAIAVVLLALMTALVVLQVVGRNFLDLGMPWADELSRFSGIALVFLTVPVLALRGQHVAVDMIPQMLEGWRRRTLLALSEIAVFIFCGIALVGFYSFLGRAAKFSTPAIGIPNWLFYAPALIGVLLLALVSVVRFLGLLRGADVNTNDNRQLS